MFLLNLPVIYNRSIIRSIFPNIYKSDIEQIVYETLKLAEDINNDFIAMDKKFDDKFTTFVVDVNTKMEDIKDNNEGIKQKIKEGYIKELFFTDLLSFYDKHSSKINLKITMLQNKRAKYILGKCNIKPKYFVNIRNVTSCKYLYLIHFVNRLEQMFLKHTNTKKEELNDILYPYHLVDTSVVDFKVKFYDRIYLYRKYFANKPVKSEDKNKDVNQDAYNFDIMKPRDWEGQSCIPETLTETYLSRRGVYINGFLKVYLLKEYSQSDENDSRFDSIKTIFPDPQALDLFLSTQAFYGDSSFMTKFDMLISNDKKLLSQ